MCDIKFGTFHTLTTNREMCLKRANWRQYTYSILLLIIVLASNSSQQTVISTPQPFRYSKAVGEDKNGFVPIVQHKNHQENVVVANAQRNQSPTTKIIPPSITPVAKNAANYDENEVRSVAVSLQELETMLENVLAIENQSHDGAIQKRSADDRALITDYLVNSDIIKNVKKFAEKYISEVASGAALQNIVPAGARLFLFKGILAIINYEALTN